MDDITASIIVACQTAGAVNSIGKLKYALLQAARYAYDFGQESVSVFSDLEETTQKFNVVFSGLGKRSDGVVNDLINGFGQSELSAKKMLSATGDLLSGFGMAKDQSLDLAEGAAKLGSDLASFSNYAGGAEGAANALTKAMLGERESLKMLGVVIREDDQAYKNFKKQAMTTGVTIDALGKTFKVSTEQQAQAVATLAVAYQQSKNAIGDFARSSDSIANQSRTLENRFVEFKASVGGLINSIMQVGAVKGQFAGFVKDVTDYIKANTEKWAYQFSYFMEGVKSGFKLIWQVANNIMENIATVMVYAWDVAVQVWKDAPGFFGAIWEDIKLTAVNLFNFLKAYFVGNFEFWSSVLRSFLQNWYSIFVDLGDIAFRSIKSIGLYFKDNIMWILNMAASLGKNFWDLLTGKKSFSDAVGGVVDDYINELKKMQENQAKNWEGFEFGKGSKKFAADVAAAGKKYAGSIAAAGGKLAGDFNKHTSEYLDKNGVKMGDFKAFDEGVDKILDDYDRNIKALNIRSRGSKSATSKDSPIANQIAQTFKGLGDAVNKMRSNSLQAVMANSLEGMKLQTRSMGTNQYQNIMQTETKKQSTLLTRIATNTGRSSNTTIQTQRV